MLRTPSVPLAAALALSVPLIGTSALAEGPVDQPAGRASNVVLDDAVEDVWVWSNDTTSWELWGAKQDADIRFAVVKHKPDVIRALLAFDNLRRERAARYLVKIKTRTMVRYAWVFTGPGVWAGAHHLETPDGDPVPDDGFEHEVDYKEDDVTMTVPRDLLDDPAWVRVSILNELFGAHEWQDNPHNGEAQPTWTERIHHS